MGIGWKMHNIFLDFFSPTRHQRYIMLSLASDSRLRKKEFRSCGAFSFMDRIEALRKAFDEYFDTAKRAFPNARLKQELRKMEAWIEANPEKSNKKKWKRFIYNWLSRG